MHDRPDRLAALTAPALPLTTHRIVFAAEQPMRLPEHLGSTWRGGFGHALKRSVCIQRLRPCPGCPMAQAGLYPLVFETEPGPEARKMRRYERVPHPYVLAPDGWGRHRLEPGEAFAGEGPGPDRGRLVLVDTGPVEGVRPDTAFLGEGLVPCSRQLWPTLLRLADYLARHAGKHRLPGATAARVARWLEGEAPALERAADRDLALLRRVLREALA
jgi:hypothetical protein